MIIMTNYKENSIHYLLFIHEQLDILRPFFFEEKKKLKKKHLYVDCFYK